ncbi:glucose-1-phosphate adenylyltransferase family protein [Vallicoccus soli]|uniref:Glucose-1-phosphate adenylyltransferase n=1 Tax=Vallicoccus soli TaxID=2339232 RepID=A0A3A3Z357_9ACTN|nr:sugar phosphate nucleotidyltransferase [Vallicoccus soli]RJK97144.1 glucose-1-phosphate adenylyltransferase [Vallicoccus soli]
MAPPRTLVLVLAGGAGGRLQLLTHDRAKPAVPFGGVNRLIDFPLSNCLHSGIADVWVSQQFHTTSLNDHLSSGRPWDLDRTTGGLLVIPPHQGTARGGWHAGTADSLWRNAELVREFGPDALVVVSADAVYRLDYADVVAEHLASGDAVTMVTTRVDPADAGRYGVVQAEDGRIVDYVYKPDEPRGDLVSNEVFVLDPGPVLDLLEELAADAGEDGLTDLGYELLPRLVEQGRAREHRFDGYWRDVGTVESYWEGHMDLLAGPPRIVLDDPAWPVRTHTRGWGAARLHDGAEVSDALVSPGATVAGSVSRSVLSPGAVVEAGATVVESVLLPGAVVRRGARVERSVLDDGVEVGPDAQVGGPGAVTLVGLRTTVGAGQRVPQGAVHPEPPED